MQAIVQHTARLLFQSLVGGCAEPLTASLSVRCLSWSIQASFMSVNTEPVQATSSPV